MADPKKEQTPQQAQDEYNQLVALVKRGKEVRVAGLLVKTVPALNDALDHQDEYAAFVAQLESGKMVRLRGRTALTLEELHFALDAEEAGPIEYVPAGVPMILGFGEQADANAMQATIDEQKGIILALQSEKAGMESEKQALVDQLKAAQVGESVYGANVVKAELQIVALTEERDTQAQTIADLTKRVEELEQAATLAAMAHEKAQTDAVIAESPKPETAVAEVAKSAAPPAPATA